MSVFEEESLFCVKNGNKNGLEVVLPSFSCVSAESITTSFFFNENVEVRFLFVKVGLLFTPVSVLLVNQK